MLSDTREPASYIATVRGRGYRFVHSVKVSSLHTSIIRTPYRSRAPRTSGSSAGKMKSQG
ncbi:hypothetical protein [Rhizobium leguminosarum]|uniref:hypothetical protein n=1 Tax=Rhizobium leguminosarum TaxID=384 RepID=UPI003D7C2E80